MQKLISIMTKWFIAFGCLIFSSHQSFSAVYSTVNDGNFNNPIVWQSGQVPSISASDTVIINTCVNFTSDLLLSGNTRFIINANGFLCGYEDIFVSGYSVFEIFGKINYDTLKATGEHLNFDNNGQHNNGAVIIVGDSATMTVNMFNKTDFPYTCPCINTTIENYGASYSANVYPNPTTGLLNIIPEKTNLTSVIAYSLSGQKVFEQSIKDLQQINISHLPKAIYYAKFFDAKGEVGNKKVVLSD
jgi:Secretion system C-terminal sorting domain